jgi:hypothetical protein
MGGVCLQERVSNPPQILSHLTVVFCFQVLYNIIHGTHVLQFFTLLNPCFGQKFIILPEIRFVIKFPQSPKFTHVDQEKILCFFRFISLSEHEKCI